MVYRHVFDTLVASLVYLRVTFVVDDNKEEMPLTEGGRWQMLASANVNCSLDC